MAVIGKIQKNSYLLLIVIGVAMLAFIFTDTFSNIGGGDEMLDKGTIAGVPIDEQKLTELENTYVDRDRQNAAYQKNDFSREDEQNSRDKAFNEIVRTKLMDIEHEKLGILVTTEELNDMISGEHIHAWISQIAMFKDNMGQYSRDSLYKFLDNLSVEPNVTDSAQYSRWKEAKIQWVKFEQELRGARKTEKYITLVNKGLFVNSLEAKDSYTSNKETRNISFVLHKYGQITEEEVGFTLDDIRAYYEEHKNDKLYEQTVESAEINFVEFQVKANQADFEKTLEDLKTLKGAFKASTNNPYFMSLKGEDDFYTDTIGFELGTNYLELDPKQGIFKYPESIDSLIQKSEVGDVFGPFESINTETNERMLAIAKINGFELQKRAWVRHILVSNNSRTDASAKVLADSLIKVIKAKDNFVEMVEQFSDDPGSKTTGGEYKWFKRNEMVKEFDEASFNGAEGELQLVKTTYGFHIVEVLGREERKLPKLAPIRRTVRPGIETIEEVKNIAYDFISDVEEMGSDSAFYKIADEQGLVYNYSKLFITSNFVTGYDNTTEIKKFAFSKDAGEGDISEAIIDGDVIKVAVLDNIIDIGVPNFEDVEDQMKVPALQKKKADMYKEKMGGTANLNEVAGRLNGAKVQTGTIKFGANSIPGGGGNEGELVGIIFSLTEDQVGAVLKPIQGQAGIYVITLDEISPAPESEDYVIENRALLNQRRGNTDGSVMVALRKKADVKDNRQRIDARGR